jgi:RHS repeat-associated protein
MVEYLYDAGGSRVGQGTIAQWNNLDPTTNGFVLTNEYVLGQSGEQVSEFDGSNRWLHTNAYAGGQLLATYDTTGYGLHFHLTDWLGTHRVQTGLEGQTEQSCQSLPFGEAPTCTEATDQFFTGLERDTHTGLDLAEYRQYSSTLGRWASPDPYNGSMDFGNPQSFNRYAYVNNRPLSAIDPSGLVPNRCGGATLTASNWWIDILSAVQNTFGIGCGSGDNGDDGDDGDDGGDDGVGDLIATGIEDAAKWVGNEIGGWFAHQKFTGTTVQRPGVGSPNTGKISDTTRIMFQAASYNAPSNFVRMPLPGNAQVCSTSTGVNFNAPPGFSVSNIAANGAANGLSGARAAVGQGGYYDFQRFQVGSTTQFFSGYTPVANIAVGAYVQGTGAPQWAASAISNTYAFFKSSNGATALQSQFRNLGFSLAAGKATYSCHPPP